MNCELYRTPSGKADAARAALLLSAGLSADEPFDTTVLVFDGGRAVATGAREGAILKQIAIDGGYRGEDLTATVITALEKDALDAGHRHLFLYTKPECESIFSGLFFYPVARTREVLLMENRPGGISGYLRGLPEVTEGGTYGAIVMNANPFTLGHLYLVERAAGECDRVFLFVLSEDKSDFSSRQRLDMVKLGTGHIKNVTVLESGPYIVSSATFPTYFLKNRDRAGEVHCELDVEIFKRHIAPRLSVTRRYVGTEPHSPATNAYNRTMAKLLPECGIELIEVPRRELSGEPVSASRVRALIKEGRRDEALSLVPKACRDYLTENNLI